MKVSRWGNSLAIRLPAAVVEALSLEEGDEVLLTETAPKTFEVSRDPVREEAIARLESLKRFFPPDFKFDREAANER